MRVSRKLCASRLQECGRHTACKFIIENSMKITVDDSKKYNIATEVEDSQ